MKRTSSLVPLLILFCVSFAHQINRIGEWIKNRRKIPLVEYQAFAKEFQTKCAGGGINFVF